MSTDFEKKELSADGFRFAIVVSRWNQELTGALVRGAHRALLEAGAGPENVETYEVPGAFELPVTCLKLAETDQFNAVIALGVVIRGDTPHFDFVAGQAAAGIMNASQSTGVPIMFGVITVNTLQQAQDRAGDGSENKGYEAAVSAIEVATLFEQIEKELHQIVF